VSDEQRLHNLGIPTNLPAREERRLLKRMQKETQAKLKKAEDVYFRMLRRLEKGSAGKKRQALPADAG